MTPPSMGVAGLDDDARRGVDGQRAGVRDGVVDADKLDRHAAGLDDVSRLYLHHPHLVDQAMLLEFILDKPHRQLGGVDGGVDLLHQVRDAADVVLVSVGDKDAADAVAVLHHIGEVRDDDVDAQHGLIREGQAAVDDEHIVAALVDGHVFSDLV